MSLFEKLFKNRETLKLVKEGSEIDFDLLYKAMDEYKSILDKIKEYEKENGELSKENQELKEEVKMLLAELSKYQNGGGGTEEPTPIQPVKAFPQAYGAAATSIDTRGWRVVHVTNLNDSGEGSLRWAITDSYLKTQNRIVVFDVSGVIDLQSWIYASNAPGDEGGYTGSIYIAGQTAPEGGITITGERIIMSQWNDIIVRYLKFRNDGTYDGSLHIRAYNEIVDHCSISHVTGSTATSMASMQEGELTKGIFSNNLLGQNSYSFILGESDPEPSRQLEDGSFTVIRNAYYNCGWRVPFKGGSAIKVDCINNIVHNWQNRLIRMDGYPYKLNHIENYYQAGGNTTNQLLWCSYLNNINRPQIYNENNFLEDDPRGNYTVPSGYLSDEANAWTEFQNNFVKLPSNYFVGTRHDIQGTSFDIWSNTLLKTNVLPEVGACRYLDNNGDVVFDRDSYDTAFVNGINTNDSSIRDSSLVLPIATSSNTRPNDFYVSNAHIPETWFSANVPSGQDHNDIAPSGYTWLEQYINQVDA